MHNHILKWKYIILLLVVIAVGVIAFIIFGNKKDSSLDLISVKRGDISEIVRVTGKTVATKDVSLGFEVSGRIKQVTAEVGSKVKSGDSLVVLDTEQLRAELAIASAGLETDRASLADVVDGTRPEEIAVSEAKLLSAETLLDDAYFQLRDAHRDSYTNVDDAIRNRTDQFFTNPNTNPQIIFTTSDFTLEQIVESGRLEIKDALLRLSSNSIKSVETSEYLLYSEKIKSDIGIVKNFLDNIALTVNSLTTSSNLSQTTIDSYKTSVVTARSNVQTALSTILSAEEKVRSAKTALVVATQNLNVLKAGSTGAEIKIAEAKVKQSEANVQKIQVQLSKSTLRAPFAGVVTKQDAKVGQVVSVNQDIVSLIGEEGVEIEAQIPEVDIGRVQVGNPVKITVDAFSGEEFTGTVSYIEPAETIIDGVVNYKSTIHFDNKEVLSLMRSGLTVNLYIETKKSTGALILPQFAVLETDEGIFVEKDNNGKKERIQVTLGVRGEEGMLEILSGLNDGDKVYNVGLRSE